MGQSFPLFHGEHLPTQTHILCYSTNPATLDNHFSLTAGEFPALPTFVEPPFVALPPAVSALASAGVDAELLENVTNHVKVWFERLRRAVGVEVGKHGSENRAASACSWWIRHTHLG